MPNEHACAAEVSPLVLSAHSFIYPASVLSVHDGHTLRVTVTLRPGLVETWNVRLARINCPELNSPDPSVSAAANAAKDFTKLVTNTPLVVQWLHTDNYGGRVDCELWYLDRNVGDYRNLSDSLLKVGLAVPYRDAGDKGKTKT